MRAALLLIAALAAAAAPRHPTVFVTPQDAARARRNVARYGWARESADAIRREADRWLAKDDAWLRSAVPKPGSAFAYGLTGCPICGSGWGAWARGGASFDRPGQVTCKNGHTLPDREHPDPGTGYVSPDGRTHYFVGSWNAFVVETLIFDALENLVYTYTLTGDERYAAKAAVILDATAAIYPASHKGCWDYPSIPPSGRLNRPWYQAARVLVHLVDHYDQLHNSAHLDAPSVVPGLTRRNNIENNLLRDGGAYCYEQSKAGRLHNGEADYLRGVLAVGVCLNLPEYVRWAVDGPFGIRVLLENNIDRDGAYYEVTPMYAEHTRELYFTFAEPLLNCRTEPYPGGLSLYRHPKLRQFFLPHNLALFGAGHMPRYGDAPPDLDQRPASARPFERGDYDFLEKLFARTGDGEAGALLAWLAGNRLEEHRSLRSTPDTTGSTIPDPRVQAGMSLYREPGAQLGGGFTDRSWLLFHAAQPPPPAAPLAAEWKTRLLESHFLGQKGIGILRTGSGADAQAVLMRFGPSLTHGHLDELNINYIARGYELTYDLGYGHSAATQTQVGWAKQTASHNLVVVDERPQGEGGLTGGSLHLFAAVPGIQVMEASAEPSYSKQGVSLYRRLVALIGNGPRTYLVDYFRVRGGRQHDWVFHARGSEVSFTGVTLGPEEPGSLAGPGVSWSDKQLNNGDLAGHPNAPVWMAPPGNGCGFLIRPRRGMPAGAWSADWKIGPATHVRLSMPATKGTELLTAVANGLYPHYPKARYVLARTRGADLASTFIAALEPHGGRPHIRAVERLPGSGGARIEHDDGVTDYVFSSADAVPRSDAGMTVAARFAWARVNGDKLESLALVGGREFAGLGWRVRTATDRWSGTLVSLDLKTHSFLTSAPLPTDGALEGAAIVFSNPDYSRTTAYRIARVMPAGRMRRVWFHATAVLGVGQVDRIVSLDTFESMVPHEYAFSDRGAGERSFFRGKRIRTDSGTEAVIRALRHGRPMTIVVDSTAPLKSGERFEYVDLKPGDSFEVLPAVFVSFQNGGFRAPAGVEVTRYK